MDKLEEEKKESLSLWKKLVLILSLFIILICGGIYYSRYIATSGLIVKEYKVTNSQIPESFHGTKVIHISDLHYKTTYFKDDVQKMVDKINQLKPDIVVLTGDLLDKNTTYQNNDFTELATVLKEIDTTIGKYAITGNHDTKYTEWETIIKHSDFTNLNDHYDIMYKNSLNPILISGLSSNLNNLKDINERLKETTDYLETNKGLEQKDNIPSYHILLIHEPDYLNEIDYQQFQLILGGHSHNGQVTIPGVGAIVLPKGAKTYYKGHYQLDETELFISSGLGTSHSPYRFFNKPSINLYRLTNH